MKEYQKGLFTIIVPCYNHEKFLPDFFESIINQTYNDIELLICDDYSSDNSCGVIEQYKKVLSEKLKSFVFFKNESNLGVVKTLNKLVNISNGEFIKMLASDDMLEEDYFSEVFKKFESDSNIDVVVTNGWMVSEETRYKTIGIQHNLFYNEGPDFSSDGLFERMYKWNRVFAPGSCYRARVFEKYGKYDETILIEDWEYSCRLALNGCTFSYVNKPLCYYRINQNSASSKINNANLEKRRIIFFRSELAIIEKYGKYAQRKIYVTKKIIYIFGYRDYARKNNFKELQKIAKGYKYSIKDIIEFGVFDYFMLVYRNIKGRIFDRIRSNN